MLCYNVMLMRSMFEEKRQKQGVMDGYINHWDQNDKDNGEITIIWRFRTCDPEMALAGRPEGSF